MKISVFDSDNWREIGASLARNKTRTFLTAFGIFWGTAMLALLMGGADGAKGLMWRNFAGFSTNLGATFNGARSISYMGYNKGSYWTMNERDVEVIRAVAPAIEYSSAVASDWTSVSYGTHNDNAHIIGVEADYSKILIPHIYEGRFINASDCAASRKVAVLGQEVAASLFGNESPVGKRVSINGVFLTCIGVAGQKGEASIGGRIDRSVIVPITTGRLIFKWNSIGYFTYTAPEGHKPSENEPAIRRALSRLHSIHPDDTNAIGFQDISDEFEMVDNLFMGLSLLALFVGFGSLMAGVIGVGNIMWIVVRERTHEFGVRRAIGAKPLDITVQVLCESIVLTLVAGIAGVCFAAIILGIADVATEHPLTGKAGFEISFAAAMAIVGIFFILGTAAGTLPAIKAMKIKPIEALRQK